jgi:hypothetical protein
VGVGVGVFLEQVEVGVLLGQGEGVEEGVQLSVSLEEVAQNVSMEGEVAVEH